MVTPQTGNGLKVDVGRSVSLLDGGLDVVSSPFAAFAEKLAHPTPLALNPTEVISVCGVDEIAANGSVRLDLAVRHFDGQRAEATLNFLPEIEVFGGADLTGKAIFRSVTHIKQRGISLSQTDRLARTPVVCSPPFHPFFVCNSTESLFYCVIYHIV